MTTQPSPPNLTEREIINAFELRGISNCSAWSELDSLSSRTEFDGLEIDLESVDWKENARFEVDVLVHVGLRYKDEGPERWGVSESFPGKLVGHTIGDMIVVDDVKVDTKSFYE